MQTKPILTIGAVIIKDGNILLVKHTDSAGHQTGIYGLPAGKVDPGEEPKEACQREIWEEVGLTVELKDMERLPHPYVAEIEMKYGKRMFCWIVYKVHRFTGEIRPTEKEIPEWVALESLFTMNNLLTNVLDAVKDAREINI